MPNLSPPSRGIYYNYRKYYKSSHFNFRNPVAEFHYWRNRLRNYKTTNYQFSQRAQPKPSLQSTNSKWENITKNTREHPSEVPTKLHTPNFPRLSGETTPSLEIFQSPNVNMLDCCHLANSSIIVYITLHYTVYTVIYYQRGLFCSDHNWPIITVIPVSTVLDTSSNCS